MKIRLHILLAAVATAWIFTGNAMAADISAEFNAANKLYAEGKFAEAAGTYEKILRFEAISPALYFNYGNAEFKSGNFGRAIAAYRQAAQLTPRDAEVRANLEFARNQVQGPTLRESRWRKLARPAHIKRVDGAGGCRALADVCNAGGDANSSGA